ncbi:universal stress protein [Desulfogranum marinum]|uniref:universal stress protein n=1 Tax=Desulfogranum marinum TaxID=453220 RepID=UPI0029C6B9C6|nr:universal stress protein [Desulfogranum marinum]
MIRTILAAMDNARQNRSLYKEALALASSMRARVVVISVTPEYEGNMNRLFLDNPDQQLKAPFQSILDEAKQYASSLGLSMQTIPRVGKPPVEIVLAARQEQADLILLGCSKRIQVERLLLGSTTLGVIAGSPCDTLLVPEDAEIKFDRILVHVNGGVPETEPAYRQAIKLAASYGSEIHALYVTDIPTDRTFRYGVLGEAEKEGWNILKQFVARCEQFDIPVVAAVRGNSTEQCILSYAADHDINLIVLGYQADSSGVDLFCGNTVEHVASQTVCPILVTRKRQG